MNKNRFPIFLVALSLAASSCNLQSAEELSPELKVTLTALALSAGTASEEITNTPDPNAGQTASPTPTLSPTPCVPTVTANSSVNIRNGPGTVYLSIDAVPTGTTFTIAGKNAENTWWYISRPSGGNAWIAMSVVTATCVPTSVAIIAAPPTPLPPSGTCKGDYVFRLIKNSDKVCVTPASKAQADADNAAAASRLATATYGPDTCAAGYVWREAFTNDHVCVDPGVRSQAAVDNAAAASRWTPGAYGPHTCIVGFVWREATGDPTDDVCVDPAVRTQAASDNAAAASRLATAAYGPDTCAAGFVWREAFSNDHVCVTPAVRSQVAADNAAAPSHTWHKKPKQKATCGVIEETITPQVFIIPVN